LTFLTLPAWNLSNLATPIGACSLLDSPHLAGMRALSAPYFAVTTPAVETSWSCSSWVHKRNPVDRVRWQTRKHSRKHTAARSQCPADHPPTWKLTWHGIPWHWRSTVIVVDRYLCMVSRKSRWTLRAFGRESPSGDRRSTSRRVARGRRSTWPRNEPVAIWVSVHRLCVYVRTG